MTRLELTRLSGAVLPRIDLMLTGGLHAQVGRPGAAGAELVAIVAGIVRPRRGTVRLNADDPFRSPAARRGIGALLECEAPPEDGSVAEFWARACELHGASSSGREVAERFQLSSLLSRSAASLSPLEARRLSLAIALAVPSPLLLALHEPLAVGLPRAPLIEALAERARSGAVVLAVVSSARDAKDLAATPLGATRPPTLSASLPP